MTIAVVVAIILVSALIAFSVYSSSLILHPRSFTHESSYGNEVEKGRIDKDSFERLEKQEVRIRSPYGYELFGYFFPVEDSSRSVIICHGITYTLYGSVTYMEIFRKRGFNILIYDHRNHGRSGGKSTTFGLYEKYDLKACTDWLYEKLGPDCTVGTMGESMGAAVALQNAALDPRLSFVIADCAFSDMESILKLRLRMDFKLPVFPFFYLADCLIRQRAGVHVKDVSPVKALAEVDTPVFFVHGQDDSYIPKEMSVEMFSIKKGAKKLYLAPNSAHAKSYPNNREEYDRQVGEFLEENGII
jgi:hypothetical protein